MHCCQEGVCVGWEVDSCGGGFQLQDGADEGWILVGETVVLLTGPGAGFDVVDTGDRAVPCGLASLFKLACARQIGEFNGFN